jgi:hypothetical protein
MARRALTHGLLAALLGATLLVGTPAPAIAVHTACRVVVTDLGPTLKIVALVASSAPDRAYRIKIAVDGDLVYQHRLRTNAAGRIRVRVDVADAPGRELVVASARDLPTGDLCVARVLAPTA